MGIYWDAWLFVNRGGLRDVIPVMAPMRYKQNSWVSGSPDDPWQDFGRPPRRRRRRRRALAVATAVAVIAGISIAAATAGTRNHGDPGGVSAGSLPSLSSAAGLPATLSKARIGSAITLAGMYSGEQVSVTVTKVIAAASPGDQDSAPPAGDRLYAVQFRLDDTGTTVYSDDPGDGATVVDSAGQSYQSSPSTAAGCLAFPPTEVIGAGDAGLGCVVFAVPTAAKIVAVQFALDSGVGPQTGQWAPAS
jgi:hypothetical protein